MSSHVFQNAATSRFCRFIRVKLSYNQRHLYKRKHFYISLIKSFSKQILQWYIQYGIIYLWWCWQLQVKPHFTPNFLLSMACTVIRPLKHIQYHILDKQKKTFSHILYLISYITQISLYHLNISNIAKYG